MSSPETTDIFIADRGIVLGGLYEEGEPLSELNQERLLAAIELYERGTVRAITVSNTEAAALAMERYLLDRGIPEGAIEIDGSAVITEDSCTYQKITHPEEDQVVLLSHRFHLPRALYLCGKYDINGSGYPAEFIRTHESALWLQKLTIRARRYQREAILLNLSLLGLV